MKQTRRRKERVGVREKEGKKRGKVLVGNFKKNN